MRNQVTIGQIKMKKLLILGAGGHGQVVVEAARTMNAWSELCF